MLRFLLLALVILVLAMAIFHFTLDELELLPHGQGVDFRLGHGQMPAKTLLATWTLEALGLTALFLLIQGRMGGGVFDGLLTGWIAWVFRGPLLVITAAGAARLAPEPWWQMNVRWFVLYSICGLLLAALARPGRRASEEEEEDGEEIVDEADDDTLADEAPHDLGSPDEEPPAAAAPPAAHA